MPLSPEALTLAPILVTVIVLWVTEALPLAVTALLGAVACVVAGVAPAKEVFRPFADPLIFLFIGSFLIAEAIRLRRLDRLLSCPGPWCAPCAPPFGQKGGTCPRAPLATGQLLTRVKILFEWSRKTYYMLH